MPQSSLLSPCADPGFFQGGGGGARRPENNLFLVLNLFYSLQRGSSGFIAKKTVTFPRIQRGSNIFQEGGGSNFFQGGGGLNANF